MEITTNESCNTSTTIASIESKPTGLVNSNYSPNHQDSSTEKKSSSPSSSPKTKGAPKVRELIEALVEGQKTGQRDSNDQIGEIDQYLTKLLEKLKLERSRLSELEAAKTALKSLVAKDNEKPCEQENMKPKDSEQSSNESERVVKENSRNVEKGKKISLSGMDISRLAKYSISEVLNISLQRVQFGALLPGKILEETLDITNKTNEDIVVQIFIDCFNPELRDTEEYTYSIRRSHLYDYNDKHYLIMSPNSSASFKLTLKAPNLKLEGEILGEAKIAVRGVKGARRIGLSSEVVIPRVICPKELYNKEYKQRIIKLAIKQGKKQESKFPLKNLSDIPVTLDLGFYQPPNVEEDPQFQCLLHPAVVTIPPQGTVVVNIALKSLKSLGKMNKDAETKSFKKVLIGSARNSALMYSFLLEIEIC